MKDSVVLLHGIASSPWRMVLMKRFLEQHHFKVHNLGYPSRKLDLWDIAHFLNSRIQDIYNNTTGNVHFVAHSLGGLVIRAYFTRYPVPQKHKWGRIVMLGTPNHGSEVSDFLQKNFFYSKFYGLSGQQLITNQTAFQNLMKPLPIDVGVIAGNRSVDPFCSLLINKPNDGKVSIDSTRLTEMKDHIILKCSHPFMCHKPSVQKQVLHFLKNGKFFHSSL